MAKPVATATLPATDHAHRWRIPEPDGPMSIGVCKVCGAEKQFKNWLSDTDFITNEEHRQAA
jgi:hypothetical protein